MRGGSRRPRDGVSEHPGCIGSIVGRTYRVSRRVEEVRTSISSNGVVPSAVNAEVSIGKVTLHAVLESENILAVLDELSNNFIPRQVSRMLIDISIYASRIVAQTIRLRVRLDARYFRGYGPESRGPVRQRAGNTASTTSGLELDGTLW